MLEGLHAWLCRIAAEALAAPAKLKDEQFYHPAGVVLAVECDRAWPVVKTVRRAKQGDGDRAKARANGGSDA